MTAVATIVFLTDYGLQDEFVGICHGVIAAIAPKARIIDLTHGVPRQDVRLGAMTLARAARYMPDLATYLAVVDPGVGSDRRAIAVRSAAGSVMVGPNNGLLSLAWEELGGAAEVAEITSERVILRPRSSTFHGRDVFAPAAAWVAAGLPMTELGPPLDVDELIRIETRRPTVEAGRISCEVTAVDGFGNVQLNVSASDLDAAGLVPLRFGILGRPRGEPRRGPRFSGFRGAGGQSRSRGRRARSGSWTHGASQRRAIAIWYAAAANSKRTRPISVMSVNRRTAGG
jgi:S-adenosyl-L-methionine hydrolase (adenosine-forming)